MNEYDITEGLSLKDQIKQLQEQRIAEILNDTKINKLQKLFLLADEIY